MSEANVTLPAGWTEIDDPTDDRSLRHAEAHYKLPGDKKKHRVEVAARREADLPANIAEAVESIEAQGGVICPAS